MKRILVFLLLIAGQGLFSQDFDRAKMDQYLEALETHDKAMFSLAILDDGEVIYQKSIGFASTEKQVKPNDQTQYRIGSITKVFTTTLIFQLIEEGKLSLDTKLSEYYPGVKNAENITISHLLSHHSGIFNMTNTPEFKDYMTEPRSKAQMVKTLEGLDSDFEPGTRGSYSNSGFVLLGYIIEDIRRDTYASQLQKRIAEPLGLQRTAYGKTLAQSENHAKSYRHNFGGWASSFETHMSIPHAAGAITSTPADLVTFMNALFNEKLINQTSLSKMKQINGGFGHGLFRMPFHNMAGYGHGGNIDAFDSNTAYFETEDMAIAITANGLNMGMNDIMLGVLSIFFNKPFEIPDFSAKPIAINKKKLAKYEGVFSSSDLPLKITLKADGNQLTAQATGQSKIPLTAYNEAEFRFETAGIVVLFEMEGNKVDYTTFTLKQGGGSFKFTKE